MNTMLVFLLMWITMGCVEVKHKNEDPAKLLAGPSEQNKSKQASEAGSEGAFYNTGESFFELRESERPGYYLAYFKFKQPNSNFVITSPDGLSYESKGREFLSFEIPHSTKYSFEVFLQDGQNYLLDNKISGVAPSDIIFSGRSVLSQKTTLSANRVYFLQNAELITQGYELTIKAHSILSQNGKIQTFQAQENPIFGGDGRHGGTVLIEAIEAYGELKINMLGENGGKGKDGEPYAARAQKGAKGVNAIAKYVIYRESEGYICKRQPGDGGAGDIGDGGRPGLNGGKGGNSGFLYVAIQKPSADFVFQKTMLAGQAGAAGQGGPGQMGGEGGDPGDPDEGCGRANRGPPGGNGPQGPPGVSGTPGQINDHIYCIGPIESCNFN